MVEKNSQRFASKRFHREFFALEVLQLKPIFKLSTIYFKFIIILY